MQDSDFNLLPELPTTQKNNKKSRFSSWTEMLQSFSIHLLDENTVRHYFISTWLKIELPHFPELFRHLCFSAFFLRFVGCSSWWFQASNLRHTVSKRLVHVRGEANVMAKPWLFERWCRVFERDYSWCFYVYIYILYVLFIVYLFIFCVVKLGLVQQSFESCANMMWA